MQEMPPGPERDRLWQEMEEHRAELERELLAGPSFPVYEATGTGLRQRAIGQTSGSDRGLEMVELVRGGYALSASKPMIAVRTQVCEPDCPHWGPEDLAEVLADERDDRADETDVDVPEPTHVEQRRAVLVVDGVETPADVWVEDDCWAALVTVAPAGEGPSVHLQVLVSARGVPIEQVRLVAVGDLGPCADGEAYARGWESAVRAQMRLAGQDRGSADAAVAALVNHMIQLAMDADWFDDAVTRMAAIEESIRWTVFESDVPSRAAQEAWLATWTTEQSPTAMLAMHSHDPVAVQEMFDARRAGRRRWSDAWRAWHAGRS